MIFAVIILPHLLCKMKILNIKGGFEMGIFFVLIIGLVIYFLFSQNGMSKIKFTSSRSPEDILKERFINGEIDAEAFKKMKDTLNR